MLDQCYSKTDAGRAEIKARALALSRSTRNLLLVLDGSRTAREWLGLVQGVAEADIAYLLEHGLIGAVGTAGVAAPAVAAVAPVAPGPAAAPPPSRSTRQLAAFGDPPQLDYQQLYAYLSSQATKQLGLMKGYVFALEVEQCHDLAELQGLALTLVERVQQNKGAEAAAQLRLALGIRV
ncbi:MAG: hypothetical protein IV092_01860 [Burkholderiaceae bacterium]|nr:hypothetical protein [Burkholderiaceae bacterium]